MSTVLERFNEMKDIIKMFFDKHFQQLAELSAPNGYLYFRTGNENKPLEASPLINHVPVVFDTDAEAQAYMNGNDPLEADVVVIDEDTSYRWDGDNGFEPNNDTQTLIGEMPIGRFYFNKSSRFLYFKYPDGNLKKIRGV